MRKVFAIILNWNRKKDTIECLKSVQNLATNNFQLEIVVVDNGSSDGSIEAVEKYKQSLRQGLKSKFKFNIIENKKNLGFAEGNNVGMKYALKQGTDYILVLNNDTELHKNLLTELMKAAEKKKDGGAFSPKIYFAKGYEYHKDRYKKSELGRVIWAAGGEVDWENVYGENRGVDEVDSGQYNKLAKVDFSSGACVLYRAKALRRVGLFDERYFAYYEDTELSVRMARRGWKNYYVPSAVLWHKVSQSSSIGSNLNDYFITRNRLLFGMKYARYRTKVALFREAVRFFVKGRIWQRTGVLDYMTGNLYKGSWK